MLQGNPQNCAEAPDAAPSEVLKQHEQEAGTTAGPANDDAPDG